MGYEDLVSQVWRHRDLRGALADPTVLVEYAILAASSHNTQPWKFRVSPGRVDIIPDFERRCPQVDPDDHHLWVSLGCATENLLEAASAAGLSGTVAFDEASHIISVSLERAVVHRSARFEAIPARQCSRAEYDGSDPDAGVLRELERSGTGTGVEVRLLTDEESKRAVTDYVMEGNKAQLTDSDWASELVEWIRFNKRAAAAERDGLYGGSMGSPGVPTWLGRIIMRLVLTPERQNRTDRRYISSSQGLAVFVSSVNDKAHWIETGRAYERFALTTTALGLKNAFVNPPVEVPELREEFASWLGLRRGRPSLIVRFGRGPHMPKSLRRPVSDVLL